MTEDAPHDTTVPLETETDGMAEHLHGTVNRHDLARFEDRTVVVTGSTRGIGEGIARRFASEGANVVVSGRTTEDGERIVEDLTDAGAEATFVRADMGEVEDVTGLIDETVEHYGGIDVLVNNAAAWSHGSFATRDIDDWDLVMDVSLRGPWLATKRAVEHFPPGGRVLNISSVHSVATDPEHFPYNAAKAGLNGMTRSMAIDLGPLDVTVNTILPGKVLHGRNIPAEDDSRYARYAPSNRRGKPDDIAALSAFLASEEAGFITGATLTADGGWTCCLFDKLGRYDSLNERHADR
jgi:NAD(P)-dependent dehydrogenase (short-subunit alcohol dehydrogenase family)